jgi:4-carboxymuconolactone decarboxylase
VKVTNPQIGLDRNLSGATPEQRRVHDQIAEGPRGSVPSPFFAMLDAPDLAAAIQEVGVVIRFKGHLTDAQRELAILATAAAVRCGYEWNYHAPIADKAGVAPPLVAATLADELPHEIDRPSAVIIGLCRRVARDRRAPDELIAEAIGLFGRPGTTELIAISGYYGLLASFIIVGGHDQSFSAGATVG